MPANVYECMFLLDTNKVAGDEAAAGQQLQGLLERNHAEVLALRRWDERRLAYPIKRGGVSHKKGLYYLSYFRADSKEILNLERDLALNELVLRYLVLHVDPKLEEAMLTVGRNPHALALQSVQEPMEGEGGEPAAGGELAGVGGEEGRGRRGPRRGGEEKE
jgi:small subunit ribosomal protein S6